MLRKIAVAVVATLTSFGPDLSHAQDTPGFEQIETRNGPFGLLGSRDQIGYGRLTTNDLFGDGADRWRSGSITSSRIWGYDWSGSAPDSFGELIELRLQGQIITPEKLRAFDPNDRRWAGALSAGLHSHFMMGATEMAVGGDLVIIGPQTQLDSFQKSFHELIGAPIPSDQVLANQIGDKVRPTVVVEAGRTYQWNDAARLRPFAEGRAGDETLVRVGADVTFGVMGLGELMIRENISGQRYRGIKNEAQGLSFVFGADIAHVFDSVYLPDTQAPQLNSTRERARLGVQWQTQGTGFFYGLTWLGEEFEGQGEDQLVGSLKFDLRW